MVSQSGEDICLNDVIGNPTVYSYTRLFDLDGLSTKVKEGGVNDSVTVGCDEIDCEDKEENLDNSLNNVNSKLRIPFHWELEFPEVFLTDKKGFDVIVSNPPFFGGSKISGMLGDEYRKFLQRWIADGKKRWTM